MASKSRDRAWTPTAPFHPTIAQVQADPVALNSRMGTYTNFCNLFDLCGLAVPAGTVIEGDGSTAQFGVTFLGAAVVTRRNQHLRMDVLLQFMPGPLRLALQSVPVELAHDAAARRRSYELLASAWR